MEVHARNTTIRTDLLWSNEYVSDPAAILSVSSSHSLEWLSVSMSHCMLKGAYLRHRVHLGLQQLTEMYSLAGFDVDVELSSIPSQILALHI